MTKKQTLTALQRAIKAKRTGSREHKYRAKPTEVDGIKFASKKEAHRYKELQLLQRAGKIAGLRKQVAFPIVINTRYIADFVYFDVEKNIDVVEDVKGCRTPLYKQKKKLMLQQHGIEIKES